MTDMIRAWHWLREDLRAGSGDEPPWVDGETRTFEGYIELCEAGYHHSPTPFDGLEYAPGPVLCQVEVSWPIEVDETKGVSRTRRLIAHRDTSQELRLYACDCAERALQREHNAGQEPDVRSWQAVEVARRFAMDEAIQEELETARTAAAAVAAELRALVASAKASWMVSWAESVASVASVASAASAKAAWAASWAASWAAAESAAWASAWSVGMEERAWQRERFNAVMMGLFEEGVK